MLDVNAGIPLADEPAILADTIELVQSLTDVPLSIDSSIVAALEAGLAAYEGKALVNSVTGEEERLEQVLPLVAKHGAAVVAITNDETGISEDPDVRFAVAKQIVRARGRPRHRCRDDVVVDPLVMPIGAMGTAGRQVFTLVRRLARRARREHHLRRVEHLVRAAEPQRDQRRVPRDGDRERDDERHHEPAARGGPAGRDGRRRADGQRSRLRGVDRAVPRGRPATATAAPRGGGGARRRRRRDGRPRRSRRRDRRRRTRSSSSRPRAGAGGSPTGPTLLDAARSLGVDLDSVCGGRGICGRCQVVVSEGEFAKHGITSARRPPDRVQRAGAALPRRATGSPPSAGSAATRESARRPRDRRAARVARSTGRSSARRPTRTRSRSTRSCACTTSRSREPDLAEPSGDLQRLHEALERDVGSSTDLGVDPHVLPGAPARPARRRLDASRSPCTTATRSPAIWPGFHDVALGVAFDVGSTTVAGHLCDLRTRRGARVGRRDEPADPLRRGPDEPRELRDDAPRRRAPTSPRRSAGALDELVGELCAQAAADARRRPRAHDRREPDHAPPGPRAGPDRARRRAVRAGDRRGRCACRRRDLELRRRTAARASTCCRASPATSAPTPRA